MKVQLIVLMEALDHQKKRFSISFTKANTEFLSLHYNADNRYLFVNGKVIFNFKTDNKNINFPTHFCLGSISNAFSATESTEVYLNPVELTYYPFMLSLDKYTESCDVLSPKICASRKTKDKNLKAFNMITKTKIKLKQWQNIFHVILNANSIVQHVTQIKNGIIKHVNVNKNIIVHAKEITVGILAHVFMRIANIEKVLMILQWSSMMKS